jgi:hypothetical protein
MIASTTEAGHFLTWALANNVAARIPKNMEPRAWNTSLKITFAYLTTEHTYSDIARVNNLDPDLVPQIVINTIHQLWTNSPRELKAVFKEEDLAIIEKPFSLITLAKEYSAYLELKKNAPSHKSVEYLFAQIRQIPAAAFHPEIDIESRQIIFQEKKGLLAQVRKNNLERPNAPFVALSKIDPNIVLHPKWYRAIIENLEANGVAVGSFSNVVKDKEADRDKVWTTHFIVEQDLEVAQRVIRQLDAEGAFRIVAHVAGPEPPGLRPSIESVKNPEEYITATDLLAQTRFRINKTSGQTFIDLLKKRARGRPIPVTIYYYAGSHYISLLDAQEFIDFLNS